MKLSAAEMQKLWEDDLEYAKRKYPLNTFFKWQEKCISFRYRNFSKEVLIFFPYTIYVPSAKFEIKDNCRKVCVAHEYGHVVHKHCLIGYSVFIVVVCLVFYLSITSLEEEIKALVICMIPTIIAGFRLYKGEEIEFAADNVAVKIYGSNEVISWLNNLLLTPNISNDQKNNLENRIQKIEYKK